MWGDAPHHTGFLREAQVWLQTTLVGEVKNQGQRAGALTSYR